MRLTRLLVSLLVSAYTLFIPFIVCNSRVRMCPCWVSVSSHAPTLGALPSFLAFTGVSNMVGIIGKRQAFVGVAGPIITSIGADRCAHVCARFVTVTFRGSTDVIFLSRSCFFETLSLVPPLPSPSPSSSSSSSLRSQVHDGSPATAKRVAQSRGEGVCGPS